MKNVFVFLFFALTFNVFAQKNEDVSLTVMGDGQTKEEALQNALRNAIEQAFGTFISSNTQVLNDRLIKDEIVSISNGDIKKYDIISETEINGRYNTTLKAIVSVSKLTTFCKNKGITVEFEGALFASNIKLQQLYAKNEKIAINNLISVLKSIINRSFDYEIRTEEPIVGKKANPNYKGNYYPGDYYTVNFNVSVLANSNFISIIEILTKTLNSLSLSEAELQTYASVKKDIYKITIDIDKSQKSYSLRTPESCEKLVNIFSYDHHIYRRTLSDEEVGPNGYNSTVPPENMTKYLRGFKVFVEGKYKKRTIDGQSIMPYNRDDFQFLFSDGGAKARIYSRRGEYETSESIIYLTKQKGIINFDYWTYEPSNQYGGVDGNLYKGLSFTLEEINLIKGFQVYPKTK